MCIYGNCKKRGKYSFDLLVFLCKKHAKLALKKHNESKLWKVSKKFKIDNPCAILKYAKSIEMKV